MVSITPRGSPAAVRLHLSQVIPKGTVGPGEDDKSPRVTGKGGPCDWGEATVRPPEAGLSLLSTAAITGEPERPAREVRSQLTGSKESEEIYVCLAVSLPNL